jgi:hypothetical protein
MKRQKRGQVSLGFRRGAVERMSKIEAQILAGRFPNAVGLAKEFETSEKTIKRDIES